MQYIISSLLLAGLVLAAPEAPLSGSNGAAPYPAAGSSSGPYSPSGWKPSGRLLVLPAKQVAQTYGVPPSTEDEPVTTEFPSTTPQEDESASPAGYTNGFQFEQLQQQPGAEHGIYHVLLPDGRLQRVEYVTAPLKSSEQSSNTAAQQNQQEQGKYQNQYAQQYQYQQNQNGKFQQGQYEQAQYTQFQQYPQGQYQQYPYQTAQSGKFQQGQFEKTSYPQPAQQAYFPSTFPQPVYQPQSSNYQQSQFSNQNNYQSSQYQPAQNGNYQQAQNGNYQQAQSGNYQQAQKGNYQQAQSGNYQQGQAEPNTYLIGYQQPQSSRYTQNKNQQPEYESNASQNQFNQKKYNKPQGSNANNQNKQVSTNSVSSESSRFTNANAGPQQQQPTQEYQPLYYAQQQNGQETPAFEGFVANVQYKDVEPIPSPVYTYNPAPLVRILRKIEE